MTSMLSALMLGSIRATSLERPFGVLGRRGGRVAISGTLFSSPRSSAGVPVHSPLFLIKVISASATGDDSRASALISLRLPALASGS